MRPWKTTTCALVAGALGWALGGTAAASSGGRLPVSNEAAVMGGAVLATGESVGSFWYNPAILGRVRNPEVEANAEVYGIRWLRAKRGVVVEGGGATPAIGPLRSTEVVSVPTMFATAFALDSNLTLGLGVYAPTATNFDAEGDVLDDRSRSTASVRYRRASQRYHVALGLGWNADDDFQLGVSLLPFYDALRSEQRVFVTQDALDPRPQSSYLFDDDSTVTDFGLSSKIGIRGRLGPRVYGAAAIETPRMVLIRVLDHVRSTAVLHGSRASTDVSEDDPPRVGASLQGWAFSTGLGLGEDWWRVGADASAALGASRATWGARVGARFRASKHLFLGGGAFFDSDDDLDDSLGALRMNWWGSSAGLEFRKFFDVVGNTRSKTIEFSTTVAAQYSYGSGTTGGVRIQGATAEAPIGFVVAATPADVHMVLVQLGSAIAF